MLPDVCFHKVVPLRFHLVSLGRVVGNSSILLLFYEYNLFLDNLVELPKRQQAAFGGICYLQTSTGSLTFSTFTNSVVCCW